jgi:hypothetical protein
MMQTTKLRTIETRQAKLDIDCAAQGRATAALREWREAQKRVEMLRGPSPVAHCSVCRRWLPADELRAVGPVGHERDVCADCLANLEKSGAREGE